MIRTFIISQGSLAQALVEAGRRITGGGEWLHAVPLGWDDDVETARETIQRALREQQEGSAGALLLLDMFGSTPYNAAAGLSDPGRIEILTGVNLPMVVRLGCLFNQEPSIPEAVELLLAKGRGSIRRGEPLSHPVEPAPDEPCREPCREP